MLQQYPPESVPDVVVPDVCTVEDPARDIQWIYPQGTDTDSSDLSGRLSALFDAAWYLQRNPDVAESGKDPLDHYLNFGWKEGRAPSPWFDPRFYLRQCPGDECQNQAPLRHYVEKGEKRGYLPSKPYVEGQKLLAAAKQAGVPSMLHVRESLEHDPDVCAAFRISADAIRAQVLESADVIVANSEFTAGNFRKKDATFVVNNIVDPALFKLHNPIDPRCIDVAMISSNQPKKGLYDFVDLARVLAGDTRIRMVLTGPDNAHIRELKSRGDLPENIIFSGYAPSPSDALARAGIVLNLSNFEETFGRTVLEAMAAGFVVELKKGDLVHIGDAVVSIDDFKDNRVKCRIVAPQETPIAKVVRGKAG